MSIWVTAFFAFRTLAADVELELPELRPPVAALAVPAEAEPAPASATGGDDPDAPPAFGVLPAAGEHEARVIFGLIEALSGRSVEAVDESIETAPLRIDDDLAGRPTSLVTTEALLASHGIYLRADGDARYLASRDRFLDVSALDHPRIMRVFELEPRHFERAAREMATFVADHNARLADGVPATSVLAVPRTGRIVVRTFSERTLRILEELVRGVIENPAEAATRLYVHNASNFPAQKLYEKLKEFLDEAEIEHLHVVFPQRSNALWIKTSPTVWGKLEGVLKVLDPPPR